MNSRIQWMFPGALTLAATLTVSLTAHAQDVQPPPNVRTKGLMLGLHSIAAPGLTIKIPEYEATFKSKFGPGAGVMIGYGFNRTFSSYVSLDIARQGTNSSDLEGTYGLGHLDIGVRANLPDIALGSTNTVPYLIGSFGRRALGARVMDLQNDEQVDVSWQGQVFGLGVGVEHFFSPHVSFDGGLQLGFGKFDTFTLDGEDVDISSKGSTSIRLRLGLTWRP